LACGQVGEKIMAKTVIIDRYNSGDIVEALNESQLNESQANTTVEGEVTQDSIQVLVLSGKFIHLKNNSIC
jgi:hypothetical protein